MPTRSAAGLVAGLMLSACAQSPAPATSGSPRLGKPVSEAQAARFDLDVFPDGRGLPAGHGNATQGAALFAQHCAACHGPRGRGASAEELVGGDEPLTSEFPDKTIGLYWPYATTLFDFIRRSKPMTAPGSLKANEVYAIVAWLLASERVIANDAELDAASLAAVRMPNRDGFIGIDAPARR